MAHLLSWPKRRALTTSDGVTLVALVEPGRLSVETPTGELFVFDDPDELRALAMQLHAAAVDRDQGATLDAARGAAARHQRRRVAGMPIGDRYGRYLDAGGEKLA